MRAMGHLPEYRSPPRRADEGAFVVPPHFAASGRAGRKPLRPLRGASRQSLPGHTRHALSRALAGAAVLLRAREGLRARAERRHRSNRRLSGLQACALLVSVVAFAYVVNDTAVWAAPMSP